jgi:hypothetical protein
MKKSILQHNADDCDDSIFAGNEIWKPLTAATSQPNSLIVSNPPLHQTLPPLPSSKALMMPAMVTASYKQLLLTAFPLAFTESAPRLQLGIISLSTSLSRNVVHRMIVRSSRLLQPLKMPKQVSLWAKVQGMQIQAKWCLVKLMVKQQISDTACEDFNDSFEIVLFYIVKTVKCINGSS